MSRPSIDQQITFIYCQDLQKNAAFYENLMGFSLWIDQGSCRIYKITESGLLGICQVGEHSKGKMTSGLQQNVIITLVTSDVDGWYEYLSQNGVLFEKKPEINPVYKIYHCFLRDPEGYLIEIQCFLD